MAFMSFASFDYVSCFLVVFATCVVATKWFFLKFYFKVSMIHIADAFQLACVQLKPQFYWILIQRLAQSTRCLLNVFLSVRL